MGSIKNQHKKTSQLQRRRIGRQNQWKDSKPVPFVIQGVQGKLRSPKANETVRLFAHYPSTGEIAPLRGSGPRDSKNEANKSRAVALNIKILQSATNTQAKTMAAAPQIRKENHGLAEAQEEGKRKLAEVKKKHEEHEKKVREMNTALLKDSISRATFDHGLSLGSSQQVSLFFPFPSMKWNAHQGFFSSSLE